MINFLLWLYWIILWIKGLDLDYNRIYNSYLKKTHLERKKYVYYPTVMFHIIDKEDKKLGKIMYKLTYSPKKFEKLLQLLKKNNIKTLTFKDLWLIKKWIKKAPERWVLLTFDDGYKSMYTNVLSLLKKYEDKWVFFIITGRIWKPWYMNKMEIKELIENWNEIWSHTINHINLWNIWWKIAKKEVIKSKQILENIFNRKIISFCYPYGTHSKEVIQLVKQNYLFARDTKPYTNHPKNQFLIWTIDTYSHQSAKKLFNQILEKQNK